MLLLYYVLRNKPSSSSTNNNHNNLYGAVILSKHCESSPGSRDKCRNSAGGRLPLDQPNRPESECRLYALGVFFKDMNKSLVACF